MLQAHAAPVDEPLLPDHDVDRQRLRRRRERDDHADERRAGRGGLAARPACATLRLRAAVLLHLLLPDRAVDAGARGPLQCQELRP